MREQTLVDSFTQWAEGAEPRLRHALTASFGMQVGTEAAADALAQVWIAWDDIEGKENLLGYAYGIGRNRARRMVAPQRRPMFVEVPPDRLPHVEPALPSALARLPDKQRIVVTLLYGYGWTMSEVAELLGIAKTSVQNHAERGLTRLRTTLGVNT